MTNLRPNRSGDQPPRPSNKTLMLLTAGVITLGVALAVPAVGPALTAATSVVTAVAMQQKGNDKER
ncbi:hypothetical protein [Allostreptomyces psammosilenae]|uniref:Uncharacterized protein n=1 Tax=Allostreptomyces psammosilenae TaxID=1892865 RepID=A0A853AB06_9ACTN|nr:hypothetical protein [Allostreptomyces psammosilenae]NYI07688.1 hypothetical protein [Allostreptomyces psammosilenae]